MSESINTFPSRKSDDSQQVSKWTRRYAQNRSLGVVVFMLIFTLLFAAIGGTSYLAGEAYRGGNMPAFWICLVLLIMSLSANLYLAVPQWGGRFIDRLTKQLYAREGQATISCSSQARRKWMILPALIFAGCVIASVIFGDNIPVEYRQPVMALYCVPFLVFLVLIQRPRTSYIALLWPILFGLHAILIVSGVPIVFTNRWETLNIFIPVVGYGLLSSAVGHLYSRFALSRLKKIAVTNKSMSISDEENVPNE